MVEKQKRKKKLSRLQAELLLPVLKEFNSLSKELIRILNRKVEVKERRIAVLITEVGLPKSQQTINVHAIDINNTQGFKKGQGKMKQKMKWEREMLGNKGVII